MKRWIALALLLALCWGPGLADVSPAGGEASGGVRIDETSFPDAGFRGFVLKRVDANGDRLLSGEEIAAATVLDMSGLGISDLTGIRCLTGMEYLSCPDNRLEALDVSGCGALKYLYCDRNKLKRLDVSACEALELLYCGDNRLGKLNVRKNPALVRLDCRNNRLTQIDVRTNEALAALTCQGNDIGSFDIAALGGRLRELTAREDLRGWEDEEFFWIGSEDWQLVLPATATVSDGETLLYKKGRWLKHKQPETAREAYEELTDEQFANFRNVATAGMGRNALYRGSDPLQPRTGRSGQAMAAMEAAGIHTVIDMAENIDDARGWDTYKGSYYATARAWGRGMDLLVRTDGFKENVGSLCRYMIRHRGPYMVHCIWGKDRTGFLCALLECLMGAGAEEVIRDYEETYYNYYGIPVGSQTSDYIAYNRIRLQLAQAFGIGSIMDPEVDLSACAEAYLRDCGLSKKQIAKLKARLAADY